MARAGKNRVDAILKELRALGLGYPGTHTKSPWPGHLDLAVKDKTFAYLSIEGQPLGISCKLPHSGGAALGLSFTKPTGYGLGKSGWVSASFADDDEIPVEMLKEWIEESYRAQAPKKLVAELNARAVASRVSAPAKARKPAAAPKAKAAPSAKKTTTKKKAASSRPKTK